MIISIRHTEHIARHFAQRQVHLALEDSGFGPKLARCHLEKATDYKLCVV